MPAFENLGLMSESAGELWEMEKALLMGRHKNSLSPSPGTEAAVLKAAGSYRKEVYCLTLGHAPKGRDLLEISLGIDG